MERSCMHVSPGFLPEFFFFQKISNFLSKNINFFLTLMITKRELSCDYDLPKKAFGTRNLFKFFFTSWKAIIREISYCLLNFLNYKYLLFTTKREEVGKNTSLKKLLETIFFCSDILYRHLMDYYLKLHHTKLQVP